MYTIFYKLHSKCQQKRQYPTFRNMISNIRQAAGNDNMKIIHFSKDVDLNLRKYNININIKLA